MDRDQVMRLLEGVALGTVPLAQALRQVEHASFEDLGFAKLDHPRQRRLGFPEVVFGQGKSLMQLEAICRQHLVAQSKLLVTRLSADTGASLAKVLPGAEYHETARVLTVGLAPSERPPQGEGLVLVACAGTTDLPVAEEAVLTARLMGSRVEVLADVGVAGLHRLLSYRERLVAARVVVAVAGMEGALPSVVGGLVPCPVIALPTSVGYGASFGGVAALLAMLNSCAPGVMVVNIDNGFGAGYAAHLINCPPER